jgi:hypothetical protein
MTRRPVFIASACAAALAAVVLALCLTTAARPRPRLEGRWRCSDSRECKVHFFRGQDDGDGVVRGWFSERGPDGYRGSGRYELRPAQGGEGAITLHGHSQGTLSGGVRLGRGRMELGGHVYVRQ